MLGWTMTISKFRSVVIALHVVRLYGGRKAGNILKVGYTGRDI